MTFSNDPFISDPLPKFREFEFYYNRKKTSEEDKTKKFSTSLKAINIVRGTEPIFIPSSASFFSFDSVSEYELKFDFAHHPFYKEVRNFMVSISRIFDKTYTPFTLYRRNIKAPVNWLYKVWSFLNDKGLINYNAKPETRPVDFIPETNTWPLLYYNMIDLSIATQPQYEKSILPSSESINYVLHDISRVLQEQAANKTIYPMENRFQSGRTLKTPPYPGTPLQGQSMAFVPQVLGQQRPVDVHSIQKQVPSSHTKPQEIQDFEKTPNDIEKNEFDLPHKYLLHEALNRNPAQKIVTNAVRLSGKDATSMENPLDYDKIESAEQASAILAYQRMIKNAKRAKQMYKKQILEILSRTVDILITSIEQKKNSLDEAFERRDDKDDL